MSVLLESLCPFFTISIDELKKYEKIHIYIDLKNSFKALYIENVYQELVEQTYSQNNFISSLIFQSILLYVSKWKELIRSLDNIKEWKIFIANDYGESIYHNNISKSYKVSRCLSTSLLDMRLSNIEEQTDVVESVKNKVKENVLKLKTKLLTDENTKRISKLQEKFRPIRNNNFNMAERFLNRYVKNVYFITLKNIESDFVPYYLITRKFKDDDKILHIICSNDHDMYQALLYDNIIQIFSSSKGVVTLDKKTVIPYYLYHSFGFLDNVKRELCSKITIKDLPILMSLSGDMGDDIVGLDGVGPVTAAKMLLDRRVTSSVIGDIDELKNRVNNGGMFLKTETFIIPDNSIWNRILKKYKSISDVNKILTSSYRLISFEQLCLWLEKNDSLFKKESLDILDYENYENKKTPITSEAAEEVLKSLHDFVLPKENLKLLME